jgi:superfamily I DNA/RNA helicase
MTELVLNKKKSFIPSVQQAAFFDWIDTGSGSCVLEAVAGAGKTTTLVKALERMHGRIFFGAYNKKIADEIQNKAPRRDGLTISTMHAAGLSAWRKVCQYPNVDGLKVRNIFKAAVTRNPQYAKFQAQVLQLVSLAKQAGIGVDTIASLRSRSAWMHLIEHFNIECFDEASDVDNAELIIKLSIKTLEASIEQNLKVIDFDDMIYAPLISNCTFDKYDWVLVDEAQDTNSTRRELARRMMHEGTRLVAVGDRHQAIYGFTGADSDALDKIALMANAARLPLTTTFRCPKAVVEHAKQWVSHIEAAETAPEGVVRWMPIENLTDEVKIGDAILCRYNAPLVTYVYKFIAKGIPARIEGREIGNGLKKLAQRWKVKSIQALQERLAAFKEREIKKYTEKEQPAKVTAVEDQCDCLSVIINRVFDKNPQTNTAVADVVAEIESIFDDDSSTKAVLFSSVHKSKGREWANVFWLQAPPNKRAVLDWMVQQETNLNYVAATRAMEQLVLIQLPEKK